MKVLIVVFLIILAIIDIIAITKPIIKKCFYRTYNKIRRRKRRKAFEKKMKELEIK